MEDSTKMEGRWFKYNSVIMNLNQISGFHARKLDQDMLSWSDAGATKAKPWLLEADHRGIAAFASKDEALKLAERIIDGAYDIKK